MSKLQETMREMHSFLRGEKTPEEIAEIFKVSPKRLVVYQNFVRNHIIDSLARNYSTFRSLIPANTWKELRDEFFAKCPATAWRMNICTFEFVDFVAQKIKNGMFDKEHFYIELLQFEWEEVAVYCNEKVTPRPNEINQPTLNPTLTILDLEYPIATFASMWRKSKRQDPWVTSKTYYQKQPEMIFVYRHPQLQKAKFIKVTDPMLFAFKVVHDQLNVTAASQLSGQSEDSIRKVLTEAAKTGIIILPENF